MRLGSGLLAAALLVCLARGVTAADVEVKSVVDAVTVFPAGAEVERVARVKLATGAHMLSFRDLPAQAQARSIRVEGKATGPLEIGSVETRVLSIPSVDPQAQASRRRQVEQEIERLEDERAAYHSEIEVAAAQKQFALNLVGLPANPPAASAGQSSSREDWRQISGLIVGEAAAAEKATQAAKLKIRTVDRRIGELKKALEGEAPKVERRTEVKVLVTARAALEAELVVRYQVPNAAWNAHYDARLMTGSRTVPPSLAIVRRAAVSQTSGESWDNVRLALSTTRPTAGTAAPVIAPLLIDFERERPIARQRLEMSDRELRKQSTEEALPMATAPRPAAAALDQESIAVEATASMARVESSAYQAVFTVPGRASVPATGDVKRVVIDESKQEPQLKVHAVPRVDERAFLYAKLLVPKSAPYLAGPVALFRDSTFVGNGRMPGLAAGEEHELGFGTDDAVRVRFAVIKESRGETGIISASTTSERDYRITIKSLHERAVAYAVIDHVPVALNDEIRIDTSMRPLPTRRNIEDKRGIVSWDGTLAAGGEQIIEAGFRISWPASKKIELRR